MNAGDLRHAVWLDNPVEQSPAVPLEPPHEVMTDEATCPTYQSDFSIRCVARHIANSRFLLGLSPRTSATQPLGRLHGSIGQATALRVKRITPACRNGAARPEARRSFHAAGASAER